MKPIESFSQLLTEAQQLQPGLASLIIAEVADEVRLMLQIGQSRRTRKTVDAEAAESQLRFLGLVNKHLAARKPMTADYILNQRSISILAWAVADKLKSPQEAL